MAFNHCVSSLFLAVAFITCTVTSGSEETGRVDAHIVDYNVPVFTVQDLREGSRRNELERILATTGLLSVVGSDQDMSAFKISREDAFSGLCTCMQRESSNLASVRGFDSSFLSDGTTRTTLATATVGDTPLPLDSQKLEEAGCTAETVQSLDALRDFVAWASKWFMASLDETLTTNLVDIEEPILETNQGKGFTTISSIVKASQNLEHFHLYTKPTDSTETFDLDFHTDAGLFLTFVPGMVCGIEGSMEKSDDFYVQTSGLTYRAIFQENSIAVMLGAGAEHWLQTSTSMKATRHAVAIPARRSRAWYGMMHLVPQDAIIQDFPKRTFADMRKAMVLQGTMSRTYSNIEGEDVEIDNDVAIGCGTYSTSSPWISNGGKTRINRRRLGMVEDASACNNSTNFFCWMSCLDIPDSENASDKVREGLSLYCLDEAELATTSNVTRAYSQCTRNNHNDGCAGVWLATVPDLPSQEVIVDEELIEAAPSRFCYGGTSMYMDGFHWTDPTCVIYLFPSWILDTAGLLTGASIGTIFFGILLEAVISKRRSVVQSFPLGWKRLTISTLFYGLQLTLGYLLMLVVMTYSGPLFMCVIFGLMGGHFIFNSGGLFSSPKPSSTDNDTQPQEGSMDESKDTKVDIPEGFTPCCQNAL